ncbi:MAG: hypothetical protein SAL07_07010 [Oscillatoria sp. PMC 1051.18]|uniref:hypothetical protein n=1 Tax=Oscillatoria salina TaxID=331517 RepID=UPI0013B7AEB2|nr:hypothetical protein [Oscillatoria salina]MBZ8180218.1 hypothetical protein [Oscillatoria salina IIICB1]MEC4891570.1 hypothetical protein [Oscillatoria sp. PMC 1050.18]MEC5029646.1 hypothetical protein [Oscillatoria sp. PMC 1051.18]NET89522.1 hypothetical protein [Kamptonema sp. SIO1D9]
MTSAMEEVQKVACKLQVTSDQINKLESTFRAFSDACNYINREVDPKLTNNVRIQSLVYRDIREKFGLSANLAVRAINRIATDRKVAKKQGKSLPVYHPTRVDYDARIFTFKEADWTVSLTLVGGRERFKLAIGNYQRGLLKGKVPASATLTKREEGNYYLKIKV